MDSCFKPVTAFGKQKYIEQNVEKSNTLQTHLSAERRSLADFDSYNPLHRADYLTSQWQTNKHRSWQPSHFNLRSLVQPPLWTSSPKTGNNWNASGIVCFPSAGVSANDVADYIMCRGCTFLLASNNAGVKRTVQQEYNCPNTSFTRWISDMSGRSVSYSSRLYCTQSHCSDCVNIYDVCSNRGVEDDVKDTLNNVECDFFNIVNEKFDVLSSYHNLPVSLEDLDCVLRMLPTTFTERDILFKHMTDHEVALIMYNGDDNDEDEELISLDIINEDVHDERLPNPVACHLERAANEYFLPILCDARQDK